ncbi:MAG: sugar transporter permease [Bacilli bacterium]|nr:sugar transporter permease [Bacilli bacterium]
MQKVQEYNPEWPSVRPVAKNKKVLAKLSKDKWLYVLLLPGALYFLVFKYLPMWGVLIAFQNYQPFLGFFGSQWIGIGNFKDFFINPDFFRLLNNTLILSLYNIFLFFPAPIVLALLLNEVRKTFYKRTVQTLIYVPHFMSMVIVVSITYVFFTIDGGFVTQLVEQLTGHKIDFLTSLSWFRPLIVLQTIWKETGWGTILFLAALAGVDAQLYEAAIVDGAGRWRQLWHITLPSIRSTIVILFILRMGSALDNGFEQIYLMTNSLNRQVADVFDTYVYFVGITQGSFSYSTAVGLFKAVIGVILIFGSNYLAKKSGESGLF